MVLRPEMAIESAQCSSRAREITSECGRDAIAEWRRHRSQRRNGEHDGSRPPRKSQRRQLAEQRSIAHGDPSYRGCGRECRWALASTAVACSRPCHNTVHLRCRSNKLTSRYWPAAPLLPPRLPNWARKARQCSCSRQAWQRSPLELALACGTWQVFYDANRR